VKTNKPFIGIEAEGPHRGQMTLFVPGSVTPEEFYIACTQKGLTVRRCYYGAGEDRKLNGFTLAAILAHFPPDRTTIEVEEIGDLWPCFHPKHTIVSLNVIDLTERADYFKKVEDGEVVWLGKEWSKTYNTPVNDSLFDTDKEI
jgi:hypothetical protein